LHKPEFLTIFPAKIRGTIMILVLQTTVGTRPESDDAIQQVITRYGLRPQDQQVSYGVDTFSYYHVDSSHDVKALINELMQLPGVAAAYIKPWGAPPM
jgi:hypothetical protein